MRKELGTLDAAQAPPPQTSNNSFVGCGRIPPASLRDQLTSSWPCSSRTSPAMTSQKLCRLVLFARVRQSDGKISNIANSSLTRPLHDGHERICLFSTIIPLC